MKTVLTILLLGFALSASTSEPNDKKGKSDLKNEYQAGIHYEIINPAWNKNTDSPVVYEFFSYMCPGCFGFEPTMNRIKNEVGTETQIIRIPVALYSQWEPHAKAFYTFEMMGVLPQVHQSLFATIHQYKKPLRTLEDIARWASSAHGIDEQTFLTNAQSFMVDSKMRKGKQMAQTLGINRIPTLLVNGKYKPKFDQLKTQDGIVEVTKQLLSANP